jgi:hypothetical protein
MVRVLAYVCFAISGSLAALYGYATGSSELYGCVLWVGVQLPSLVDACRPGCSTISTSVIIAVRW